ncbi:MAG: ferritin-like domain-containing protein [Proteobacteria bacterium]|nr:ferritin-like domain-containing protein [Pseudomonadota bacterium]
MKPSQNNISINIDEIRNEARTSINDGSVTADYPLNLQEAYKLLNDALATEILCVLRYRHHQIIAKGINRIDVAAEFEEHALEEEHHMLLLAERINQLGGEPDFNPATVIQRSATEFKSGNTLEELIKENLIAERIAIMVYRKLILWFGEQDPTTRRMLELILAEEEEHADDLSDLLF